MPSQRIVLVVDDDSLSQQFLQSLLATENYDVLLASSGPEALELAARTPPDLVLLDVIMPGMDGFEVCRQLRANPVLAQVPIIMLTAMEGRAAQLRGLETGADEFLRKPVDPTELRTRVQTITRLNRFRQLSDERARFETAVAYSPDGIVLTDGEGRILNANKAFVQLVGRTPENVLECFRSDTAALLRSQVTLLDAAGRRVDPFETQLLLSAAPKAYAEITVVRLPWSEGTILEFIFRDITDRKQLEAQLFRLQRIELLGQLAGGVVHDVNNMMMAITMSAEILHDAGTPDTRKRTGMIRESAERASTLLKRILIFAGNAGQKRIAIKITQVLRETAAITKKLLDDDVTMEIDTPLILPVFLGDPNDVHQVIMNLCLNALDAMPAGGKLLLSAAAATLSAADAQALGNDATAGDFLRLSVRDTGTGIAPEVCDRLFDPFFTTKPRESATGLGLATVLRVMRRHKGFVCYETEVGVGSCFTCYFPVQPAAARSP